MFNWYIMIYFHKYIFTWIELERIMKLSPIENDWMWCINTYTTKHPYATWQILSTQLQKYNSIYFIFHLDKPWIWKYTLELLGKSVERIIKRPSFSIPQIRELTQIQLSVIKSGPLCSHHNRVTIHSHLTRHAEIITRRAYCTIYYMVLKSI